MKSLIKKPSAWIPIVMSFLALSILIVHVLIFGIDLKQQKDEGTEAHLFQILMVGEIPIIAFFLIKWLPKKIKETLLILLLQFISGCIPLAVLFFLENL